MASAHKDQLKTQVYEELKVWDKRRAQILKNHLKSVEEIKTAVNIKIEDSKQFLLSLETTIEERINELVLKCGTQKSYIRNSAQNSSLVLEKNKAESYDTHYQILKELLMYDAQETNKVSEKLKDLSSIYTELRGYRKQEEEEQRKNESRGFDESSILMAKGCLKYIIECELSEVVSQVMELCEKVSEIYNKKNGEDLFLAIDNFVNATHRQTLKHREIGRELISYVSASMKREIKIQSRVRNCVAKWAEIDGPIQSPFSQQIISTDINAMIKHFYDMNELSTVNFEETCIEEFLNKQISKQYSFQVNQFEAHNNLVLCEIEGFYEGKTAAVIILTMDCYVHFVRVNKVTPDFSLQLNADLTIRKEKQFTLFFTQFKKKFYFKKEKEFSFHVEFNTEEDLLHFKSLVEKVSNCKFQ